QCADRRAEMSTLVVPDILERRIGYRDTVADKREVTADHESRMCELERRAFFEGRYRAADDLPGRLCEYAVVDANQIACAHGARRSEFAGLRDEAWKVRVDDQRAPRSRKH